MPIQVGDDYSAIRRLIDDAQSRPKILREDGTEAVARKHHLKVDKMVEILRQWHETGVFVSPYSKGVYTYTLMALVKLGVNEPHSINRVHDRMKAMMTHVANNKAGKNGLTDWQRFTMDNPSAANHLEPKAKIWQNARQFVRYGGANPYGLKLSQIGCVLDRFEVQFGGTLKQRYIRLNTYAFRGFKKDGDAQVIQPLYLDNLPDVASIPAVEKRGDWTMGPKV